MVFILHKTATKMEIESFVRSFNSKNISPFVKKGTEHTAVCLIGNTKDINIDSIVENTPIVSYGKRITEPYKMVNKSIRSEGLVIELPNCKVGPNHFTVIAGPCAIESEKQINTIADAMKNSGVQVLRGGAFKPRSSPHAFQGHGEEGIQMLLQAKKEFGLPIISEIMNQTQIPLFDDVDIIQIGARNMQNFDLLKEVGSLKKPILLKRGLSSTIEELLLSAEYILAAGNDQVILCERGIRTFETATRNTLDLSAVVALKQKTYLPIFVDPSHAAGKRSFVAPLTKAAIAAGADGVMIEVHNNPQEALCDGAQSMDLTGFAALMKEIKLRVPMENKQL